MIRIHHVYGKVAHFPWENNADMRLDYFGRGDKLSDHLSFAHFQKLSNNIRIVHESGNENYANIHEAIKGAKRIFCLGFGYAEENLEILKLSSFLKPGQLVYGTALGFFENEIHAVKRAMGGKPTDKISPIKIVDMDCVSLLRAFL